MHLCTLLYRAVWRPNSAGLYFKPALSERKHKFSGNGRRTTILFLKACLFCSAMSEFQQMDFGPAKHLYHGDSPDKQLLNGCYAISRNCKMKNVSFIVFVFYVLFV